MPNTAPILAQIDTATMHIEPDDAIEFLEELIAELEGRVEAIKGEVAEDQGPY